MKFQLKALSLSLTVGLIALLGACTSVNSSTPSTETPSADDSVELEGTTEGTELETPGLETSEEMETTEDPVTGLEETETPGLETSEEMETTEDPVTGIEEMETPEIEATEETEDPNMESNLSPLDETEESEVIVPEGINSEVETESEAAENVDPELEPAQ